MRAQAARLWRADQAGSAGPFGRDLHNVLTIMGPARIRRKRCEKGIARAKRRGTKFGRPAVLDDRYASAAEPAREYASTPFA